MSVLKNHKFFRGKKETYLCNKFLEQYKKVLRKTIDKEHVSPA
jgi:hypothetical protein